MPLCDLRYAEVVGMHWEPDGPDELEACCRKKHGKNSVSFAFCMDICSLCCKKLIIEFKCPEDKPDKRRRTPTTDVRDYPTVIPTDNGVSFTLSSYGVDLPIVFGADKLPGNVFWASPIYKRLIDAENYYSTVDFAFGICEGEIDGMLRLWLGEKLLVDNSASVDENGVIQANDDGFVGGFQVDLTAEDSPIRMLNESERVTKISVFTGSETQLPEGIMVDRDGFDEVPAYRGTAFVLFENFIIADNSIPALLTEIISNSTNEFPRAYSDLATFDTTASSTPSVIVDVSYDYVYVATKDSSGSPTPAGYTQFDNNDLENLAEMEIRVAEGFSINYQNTRLLPLTGFLMMTEDSGNAGYLRVFNPFAQTFVDNVGPAGGISGHELLYGMSALDKGSIAFVGPDPITGEPMDVFMGWGTTNSSLGFCTVNKNGYVNMVSVLNAELPETDGRAVFYPSTSTMVDANPTFYDGASTDGTFIYCIVSSPDEATESYIVRVTVGSESLGIYLDNPLLENVQTISCSDLIGLGFSHNHVLMLVDPSDDCLVIFTHSGSAYGPMVWKYNPFTGAIVWKTKATNFPSNGQGSDQVYQVGSTYAWIGASGAGIFKLDMITGTVTEAAETVTAQNLPIPGGGSQFYNGAENSITYPTTTTAKYLTKVYLDRLSRSSVGLGTIVQSMLQRVGLLKSDMDIQDLVALTLTGYTIHNRQPLRTTFAELGQVFKFDLIESNGRVTYKTRGGDADETIESKYLGDVEDMGWLKGEAENDMAGTRKLNLTYRDIDREYDNNVQSIMLPPYGSQSFDNDAAIDVTVPIVLDATTAKSLGEILLYGKLVYDTTYRFNLPPRYMRLDPGDVIDIDLGDDEPTTVRLRRVTIGADNSVQVEASAEDQDIYNDQVNLFGATGFFDPSGFNAPTPRIDVHVLEIPFLGDAYASATANTQYLHFVLLNNKATATITSDVTVNIDGTTDYTVKRPANFPTWGYVTVPPTQTSSQFSTDYTSQVTVRMVSQTGHTIASCTYDELMASDTVNLVYCGGELWQFQTATDNGDGTWTFTVLHRGKFGTNGYVNATDVGEKWVLLGDANGALDTGAIRIVELNEETPMHAAQFFLPTSNPLQTAPISIFAALNLSAWTVADFSAVWNSTDVDVSWQRRTRYDGSYPDDGDETVPVNEIDESYVVYFYTDQDTFKATVPETYLRKVEMTGSTTSLTYTAAEQASDGYDGTTTDLYVTVYQQGGVEGNRYGMPRTTLLLSR